MKEKQKKTMEITPSARISHFHSDLGTSPQKSIDKVSQPVPEIKKSIMISNHEWTKENP